MIAGYNLFEALGGLSVAATFSFFIFRLFGKNWIETQFQKNLEDFKHQQNIELSKLRVEIDTQIDGNVRLRKNEFESLTKAWLLFHEAFAETAKLIFVSPFFSKLNNVHADVLEEILEDSGFSESQKATIRHAEDRAEAYLHINYTHRINSAYQKQYDYLNHISQYGIFFDNIIAELMDKAHKKLAKITSMYEIGIEPGEYKMRGKATDEFVIEMTPLHTELKNRIHSHLRLPARVNSHVA